LSRQTDTQTRRLTRTEGKQSAMFASLSTAGAQEVTVIARNASKIQYIKRKAWSSRDS